MQGVEQILYSIARDRSARRPCGESCRMLRLGEKPLSVARVRTDIPKPRHSCRIRSPIFTELIERISFGVQKV